MDNRNTKTLRIPLLYVITVPLTGLLIMVAGLVGYFSYRNGQLSIDSVVARLEDEISARIEERLLDFLISPHRINQINADAIHHGILDANDPQELEKHFLKQIQVFDSVTSIYFGNIQGGLVDAGREGPTGSLYVIFTEGFVSGPFHKYATDDLGAHTELLVTVPEFDARTRPWYTKAVEKGSATWGDVYLLFTGQDMALSASQPVYAPSGELLGVVSTDIFTSHLNNLLANLSIGKTGQTFVMERNGLLVASSTGEMPFTESGESGGQRRLSATESLIPGIRLAAEFLDTQFGDLTNISSEQRLEFEIDGYRQYLKVLPVSGFGA